MSKIELSALTDKELQGLAKKRKTTAISNAFLIGFLIGIIVYSIAKSTWGLVTLIPLFMIYKLINQKGYDPKELDAELQKRNLS